MQIGPEGNGLGSALPSNQTATTQTAGDNTTSVATDQFVQTAVKPLGYVQFAPPSVTTYTLVASATGITRLDATNLVVTFTVPASGQVYATLGGFVKGGAAAATSTVFGIVSTTTSPGTVVGVLGLVNLTPTGTAADNGTFCTMTQLVTGLTPSASLTWYFGAMYNGTASSVLAQGTTSQTTVPTGAPAFMEILPA